MRIVEDREGRRFALVKRSDSSSLVVDLETGDRGYRDNRDLRDLEEEPTDPRAELIAVLSEEESVPIRAILDRTTLCESDLFALRKELELDGLISEVDRDGERAWTLAAGPADEQDVRDQS